MVKKEGEKMRRWEDGRSTDEGRGKMDEKERRKDKRRERGKMTDEDEGRWMMDEKWTEVGDQASDLCSIIPPLSEAVFLRPSVFRTVVPHPSEAIFHPPSVFCRRPANTNIQPPNHNPQHPTGKTQRISAVRS